MTWHESHSPPRPEITARVDRFVDALRCTKLAGAVVSVIVAGSASRGEETWQSGKLVSDIDLMLVTRRTNPLLAGSLSAAMDPFRRDGIDGGVTPLTSLRKYRTFAFYEAQAAGVVAWTNGASPPSWPAVRPHDIPRWESIRVLANRMFEQLKAVCGQTSPRQAANKSYEALVEAALGLEGRYRPTYRQRLAEVTSYAPALLQPRVLDTAASVLQARLGELPANHLSVKVSRADLLEGLGIALRSYLGCDGELAELLRILASRERHWRHRVYWAGAGHAAQSGIAKSHADPIISLWQQAAAILTGASTSPKIPRLIAAWKACPQILHGADPAYAAQQDLARHRVGAPPRA
jgi:hypothetical protein